MVEQVLESPAAFCTSKVTLSAPSSSVSASIKPCVAASSASWVTSWQMPTRKGSAIAPVIPHTSTAKAARIPNAFFMFHSSYNPTVLMTPPEASGRLPRPAEKALAGDVAGIVPPSMPSVKGMNCSEYVFTYIKGWGVKKQKNVSSFWDSKARIHLPASCCNFAGKCNFKTFNCIFEHTLCSFNSPKSP